jgi:Zn-dependent M28 family amino/carboxypeptidase
MFIVAGKSYKNVVASFGREDAERLIVGAHYDVCEDQPGADDNASAVAGLLETARLLNANKPKPNYRIDFVAYSLEEPPYFATENMGSAVHAKSLYDAKVPVKAMICYEMIGYFSDKPNSQQFPDPALSKIYPTTGNFIIVVGLNGQETFTKKVYSLMKANSSIDVQTISFPVAQGLAGLSDHRNYWKYNYPAVMINDTSFLRNPHYHKKSDTIDTLDFKKMAEVVRGAYAAIVGL